MDKRQAEVHVLDILSDGKAHWPKDIRGSVPQEEQNSVRDAISRLWHMGKVLVDGDLRVRLPRPGDITMDSDLRPRHH